MPLASLRQLALQATAAFAVLSLAWPYHGMQAAAIPWLGTALAIGGVALVLATLTRQPVWWKAIHAAFMPLVWATTQWTIDPTWFLLAFILLLLIYRGAVTEQVPLYLTNTPTTQALAEFLATRPDARFLDLGAGLGSTVIPLARQFPQSHFAGIENAPLTWALGWLRTRFRSNLTWCWGNLWAADLKDFDVVYAFLSPAPMAALWDKVQAEMPPGSVFVSNSFPVPEMNASRIIEVPCHPPRILYCYQR